MLLSETSPYGVGSTVDIGSPHDAGCAINVESTFAGSQPQKKPGGLSANVMQSRAISDSSWSQGSSLLIDSLSTPNATDTGEGTLSVLFSLRGSDSSKNQTSNQGSGGDTKVLNSDYHSKPGQFEVSTDLVENTLPPTFVQQSEVADGVSAVKTAKTQDGFVSNTSTENDSRKDPLSPDKGRTDEATTNDPQRTRYLVSELAGDGGVSSDRRNTFTMDGDRSVSVMLPEKQRKDIKKQMMTAVSQGTMFTDRLRQQLKQRKKIVAAKNAALVRSLLVVCLVMVLSHFPFFVCNFYRSYARPLPPVETSIATTLLVFVSSSVNWIVYGVMSPSFKRDYSRVLLKIMVQFFHIHPLRARKFLSLQTTPVQTTKKGQETNTAQQGPR